MKLFSFIGCNLYCLDKNYGGFLIIWDRIFGTFAEERKGEEIIYGLVFNQPSFNPLFLQIFYNEHVINKWKSMDTWQNKLAAIWKGPSWQPGKPRLGAEEDKLDIKKREKYDVKLPMWCNIYLCLHFTVVVIGFQELALRYMGMNPLAVLGFVAYILISLTTIGMLFENRPHACILELARCLLFVSYVQRTGLLQHGPSIALVQSFFILSSCFWVLKTFKVFQIKVKTN
ncbi:Alkylglycerol monooxygenase [Blattella germanica]|nr:Alkylglycerol monooxygenase [Blattella germanica]